MKVKCNSVYCKEPVCKHKRVHQKGENCLFWCAMDINAKCVEKKLNRRRQNDNS